MTHEHTWLSELQAAINNRIQQLEFSDHPKNLYDPIRYILALGGKRLRPAMALLTYKLFRDDFESFLDPAIATEVFHNFTLIHDDIMDKAPLRRGNPTVHEKWTEETAILSGDVMMVVAYQLMMKSNRNTSEILQAFNTCAIGVCEGQQLDIDFEMQQDVSIEEYLEMIRLKTSVLIGFCARLGALGAGASSEDAQHAYDFAEHLGIGFQLQDDFLDVFGDQQKVGKQVGGDIIANKKTFLWIRALQLASQTERDLIQKWEQTTTFNAEDKVREITGIYENVGVKEETKAEMNLHFDKSMAALDAIDVSEDRKKPLRAFATYLIQRDQ